MTVNDAKLIELQELERLRDGYDKAIEESKLGEDVDMGTLLLREKMALDKILEAWKQVEYSPEYVNLTNNPILLSIARQGQK